jgi:hypothetical protein
VSVLLVKTVKVHDDTHRALKLLKAKKRTHSLDQVIRDMIKVTTGASVEKGPTGGDTQLISYLTNDPRRQKYEPRGDRMDNGKV